MHTIFAYCLWCLVIINIIIVVVTVLLLLLLFIWINESSVLVNEIVDHSSRKNTFTTKNVAIFYDYFPNRWHLVSSCDACLSLYIRLVVNLSVLFRITVIMHGTPSCCTVYVQQLRMFTFATYIPVSRLTQCLRRGKDGWIYVR